ncbi:MAG: acetamidase/formamidase family protein [Coriobacteriales bacterium]|nr:acetamidase/formamidase family protein [Coriobacteriales bacterium]
MIELDDSKVTCVFSQEVPPALFVDSGTTVRIRTRDCFSNQLQKPENTMDSLDWDATNPATGPIYVRGAVAGGALKVKIESIDLDGQIACCTGEAEGVCGDLFKGWSTGIRKIQDGKVIWGRGVELPLAPMIGVIGVAPAAGLSINCGTPGTHGGNMDCTQIGPGATVYFPVEMDGAMFSCGDMHAVMGDGEIGVSGAEVAGWPTVTLTAMPGLKLNHPLLETDTEFGVIVSATSLDAAADEAVHELVRIITARVDIPADELVMLLSLCADVRVCQMVDPLKTVRFMAPKYVLDALGFVL